ncbi:MAG: NnrU family protein [Methylobacteriaceae bacterium]|nr:NnrU family protein [Methylobacteriaceae bacterium]
MRAVADWGEFALAFALFLLTHALPARPKARAAFVAALGAPLYVTLYSAVSLALLYWLIGATARAPYVELWGFARWQMLVPQLAMLVACALAALAIGRPNPLSFGGARNAAFDPARPGIVGLTRHPILAALALWAGAHLVPNGDLAHVVLFGLFLAMALIGMRALDARQRRAMGAEAWARAAAARLRPSEFLTAATAARLAAGLAVYALLVLTHRWFAGVAAMG